MQNTKEAPNTAEDKKDFEKQTYVQKINGLTHKALMNQKDAVQELTKTTLGKDNSISGLQIPNIALARASINLSLAILAQDIRSKNTSEEEWELLIDEALENFIQTGETHNLQDPTNIIADQFKKEVLEVLKTEHRNA